MSDFLTRLAARQLGATPGAAPRLRSRFESAVGDETIAAPDPLARLVQSRDHEVVPDRPPVALPTRAQAAVPARPLPAAVATGAELTRGVAEEPRAAEDVPSASAGERGASGRREDGESPRREPHPPAAPKGEDPRSAGPAVPIREVTREITLVRVDTDGERAEPPRPPRQLERLVPIPEARRVEVRGPIAAAEPRRQAEEPAVVEITIGCVEVRAVPPLPAPPARTPPRTAPSLSQYLERRRGGAKR